MSKPTTQPTTQQRNAVTPEAIKQRMARILKLTVPDLRDEASLTDLVTDSFLLVEMVVELQDDLGTRLVQDDLKDVKTVGDLVRAFVESKKR